MFYTFLCKPISGQDRVGGGIKRVSSLKINPSNTDEIFATLIALDSTNAEVQTSIKLETATIETEFLADTAGKPLYAQDQLIIKFRADQLDSTFINSRDKTFAYGTKAVKSSLLTQIIAKANITDAKSILFTKVFPNLTPADQYSISRLGDTVKIPDFYTTLLMHADIDMNLNRACDSLQTLWPKVRYAEIDYVAETTQPLPNDPLFASSQSALKPEELSDTIYNYLGINGTIDVVGAWQYTTGRPDIKVGVYDTGIFWQHEDFQGNGSISFANSVVKGGYDYFHNSTIPAFGDANGHGTKMAGIIGAIRNNEKGIAGVAGGNYSNGGLNGISLYDMHISDITGYNNNGNPYGNPIVPLSKIAFAWFEGATSPNVPGGKGLHIMNNSWAKYQYAYPNLEDSITTLRDVARYIFKNKVTLVTGRGNNELNYHITNSEEYDDTLDAYPACLRNEWVITASACNVNGGMVWKKAADNEPWRSMYSKGVDIAAPGGYKSLIPQSFCEDYVYSTTNSDSYAASGGTSSASAYTSGVSALMKSYFDKPYPAPKNLSPEDIESILKISAEDVSGIKMGGLSGPTDSTFYPVGYDKYTGFGLLKADKALQGIDTIAHWIEHRDYVRTISDINIYFWKTDTLFVPYSINNLLRGRYKVDVYKINLYSDEFTNPGCIIDTAWVRNSSSDFYKYPLNDTLDPEVSISLASYPSGSGTIYFDTGYVYHFVANLSADSLNVWFPTFIDPSATVHLKSAITLYHSCPVGIIEKSADDWVGNPIPNPASESTTIQYELANNQMLAIDLFDISGRHLKSLHNQKTPKGTHRLNLKTFGLNKGIYFITFVKENGKSVRKICIN